MLGQSISQNRTLEELTLSWNNLKNSSGHEFVESLKINKVLKKLKLDNNLVGLSFIDQIEEFMHRNNLSYQSKEVDSLEHQKTNLQKCTTEDEKKRIFEE